ncbi:unnamed protein product [Lymnaea stagnalis]|uniref:Cytochrome b5 n=1 Tax=Lymnaea stagnalis TaxID=6523 RepID=A0AAV2IPL8_LYMST
MSSAVKRGLCWALAALQVTPENDNDVIEAKLTTGSSYLDINAQVRPDSQVDKENVQPAYSRTEVADHCSSESCWMVINNRVYDVTRFLRIHPGGDDIMLEYGGHDATSAFIDKGHSLDAYDMLAEYCIGVVTKVRLNPFISYIMGLIQRLICVFSP